MRLLSFLFAKSAFMRSFLVLIICNDLNVRAIKRVYISYAEIRNTSRY